MPNLTKYQENSQLSPPFGPLRSFPKGSLESESEIFIFPLLRTIKRRIKLVLASFLAIVLLGIGAYMMWPTRYESTAELSYSFDTADMMQLSDETLGSLGSNDADTKLATQVAILKNRDLLLDVIAKLDLARNPQFYKYAKPGIDSGNLSPLDQDQILHSFDRRLEVKVIPRTYLVAVSFRNASPQLAQRVLAELLSEYVQRSFEARYLDTKQSADWLQKQVDGLRADVETKERQLVQLQEQKGILLMQPPPSSGSGGSAQGTVDTTASVRLAEVIKAQVAGEAERIDKEAKYRASLTGNSEMLAAIAPESKIVALRQEQVALEGHLASLTSQFGPNYPDVVATRSQLKSVDEAVKKEVGNLQEQLREQYLAAQRGEDLLQQTADSAKNDAFKQIGAAAELIALQEEVDSGQRLYEDLERKLKESGVLAGLKSTQTDIVVKPNMAYRPVEPNPLMFAAISFFLGAVGSISAAVLRENSDRTLKNAYEVEQAIQIPVLGQVPHQTPAAQDSADHGTSNSVTKSLMRGGPKSRVAESFRSLCSSLLLSSTRPPKIILVTSSLPDEGKTSVSVGIATILSQRRTRVLLIEADMRRPTIHRTFELTKAKSGLATVLSGSSTFEESMCHLDALPAITVLPSGPIPPYPAELLDSDAMAQLLARAREEFDYVVVDTPPLLSVSDALPLTALVDAVLVVVRSRKTRLHALVDTNNVVSRTGVRISGVVLNDVADLDGGHYYYGYYNSYYDEAVSRVGG